MSDADLLPSGDGAQRKGRWPQSTTTQRRVLEAAATLFAERGYEATNVSDIVAASGVSTGSIYHQVGGKAEVFIAVARDMIARHAAVSEQAMAKARACGATEPTELYLIGAEAYLLDLWEHRAIERVLFEGDGPPGFAKLARDTGAKFVHASLGLRLGDPPLVDSAARAITALLHAAALQLLTVDSRSTAEAVATYFLNLIRRLASD